MTDLSTTYSFQVLYADWVQVEMFTSLKKAIEAYDRWDNRPPTEKRIVAIGRTVVF